MIAEVFLLKHIGLRNFNYFVGKLILPSNLYYLPVKTNSSY